jgi:hypothetical protein
MGPGRHTRTRRLDVVNVRLGLKVGDLADRLAATWPFASNATGGVLKIYFRTRPAESLAYLRDRVKLDEPTALRIRDGVPNPYPAAPPAAAEATTDALVAHDTSRKRHLANAPGDSPADSCSEAAPMDEPRAADEARLGEGAAELHGAAPRRVCHAASADREARGRAGMAARQNCHGAAAAAAAAHHSRVASPGRRRERIARCSPLHQRSRTLRHGRWLARPQPVLV